MPKKSVNLSTDAIEKVEAFQKADSRSSFSNALEIIIQKHFEPVQFIKRELNKAIDDHNEANG